MKIAVASGKGGTGKTTIALALAEAAGKGTELLDCDVEEPNCHLFIKAESAKEPVTVPKPVVNEQLCNGCRQCSEICQFNAIAVLGKKVLLFNDLCHGCGGCVRVCPTGALTEEPYRIGEAGSCRVNDLTLIDGRLAIGQAMTNCLLQQGIEAVTGELNVRYLHPVSCTAELELRARVATERRPLYVLTSELVTQGRSVARASAKFMMKS